MVEIVVLVQKFMLINIIFCHQQGPEPAELDCLNGSCRLGPSGQPLAGF
jgi:hypothetical protein